MCFHCKNCFNFTLYSKFLKSLHWLTKLQPITTSQTSPSTYFTLPTKLQLNCFLAVLKYRKQNLTTEYQLSLFLPQIPTKVSLLHTSAQRVFERGFPRLPCVTEHHQPARRNTNQHPAWYTFVCLLCPPTHLPRMEITLKSRIILHCSLLFFQHCEQICYGKGHLCCVNELINEPGKHTWL